MDTKECAVGIWQRWMVMGMAENDTVQVTRCKNCREFKPGFIRPYLGWCGVWDTTVRETGYCHHGKPRCGEAEKPVWPPEEEPEVACED